MTQSDKARRFAAMHRKGNPLVLVNIWDAGSARAVAQGGAKAIATGSWSMAAAQGYPDGEAIPLDLVEQTVGRIVATVDLPVTVDFEAGYAVDPEQVADNVERIIAAGAIGINVEDGIIGGKALYDIAVQCRRIEAIRERADRLGVALFINARTDLFLLASDQHETLCEEALERARAYKAAGASGFFVPGLVSEPLIEALCTAVDLPTNIMMMDGAPSIERLGRLGASRISHGPLPFLRCMQCLREQASAVRTGEALHE